MQPVSVITINYNNLQGLVKTIESVLAQTPDSRMMEFIVIDGGSTDGSKDYIISKQKNINYWISEKDNGVFHAMNKGIRQAKHPYLLFLNSGDYFLHNNVLNQLKEVKSEADIIYGDILWLMPGDQQYNWQFPASLSFEYFIDHSLPHQASFIRKELFTKYGLYDESERIISDWKFFIEVICRDNASYHHCGISIAGCDAGGMSCDPVNRSAILAAKDLYLRNSFPAFYQDYKEKAALQERIKKLESKSLFRLLYGQDR